MSCNVLLLLWRCWVPVVIHNVWILPYAKKNKTHDSACASLWGCMTKHPRVYLSRPCKPWEWYSAVTWREQSAGTDSPPLSGPAHQEEATNSQWISPHLKTIWPDRNLDKQKKDDKSKPDRRMFALTVTKSKNGPGAKSCRALFHYACFPDSEACTCTAGQGGSWTVRREPQQSIFRLKSCREAKRKKNTPFFFPGKSIVVAANETWCRKNVWQ